MYHIWKLDKILDKWLKSDECSHSEDSGIMLDVSSITEQDDYSPARKKPKLGDPQTTSSTSGPGSNVEDLGRRAQELVERINQSREQDQEIISSFQDQLLSKVPDVHVCRVCQTTIWFALFKLCLSR